MNIETANAIPMSDFLKKLQYLPYRDYQSIALYKSPYRQDKAAIFRINKTKNTWYDHGTGLQGTLITFVIELLKHQGVDHTTADALRFIDTIWTKYDEATFQTLPVVQEAPQYNLRLNSVSKISMPSLIGYLNERAIPLAVAKQYCKQAEVANLDNDKKFYALTFKNESDGDQLMNSLFEGCVDEIDISFIRGTSRNQEIIHVFKNIIDYMSTLILLRIERLAQDAIILNSYSNLPQALPFMKNYTYRYIYSWLDNDMAGAGYRKFFDDFTISQNRLKHVSLHRNYSDCSNVNSWLVSKKLNKKEKSNIKLRVEDI